MHAKHAQSQRYEGGAYSQIKGSEANSGKERDPWNACVEHGVESPANEQSGGGGCERKAVPHRGKRAVFHAMGEQCEAALLSAVWRVGICDEAGFFFKHLAIFALAKCGNSESIATNRRIRLYSESAYDY